MHGRAVGEEERTARGLASKQIEGPKPRAEGPTCGPRRYLVEYDDVMNKQREIIYGERRKVLEGVALRDLVLSWVRKVIEDAVGERCESRHPDNWDIEGLVGQLGTVFPLPPFGEIPSDEFGETKEAVIDRLMQYAETAYQAKEAELTEPVMRQVEQFVVLKTIDSRWISYLTMMEHFKEGIGLRAFGQKDPLVEYKNEAFQAFQELLNDIQFEIASNMYRVQVRAEPPVLTPPPAVLAGPSRQAGIAGPVAAHRAGTPDRRGAAGPVPAGEIGRDDPRRCGSRQKYKKRHRRQARLTRAS